MRKSGGHSEKRDKHDKHGTSKSERSKGKDARQSHSSSSQRQSEAPLSFLFLVNQLGFDEPITDYYYHPVPPYNRDAYDEVPSRVMRYYNGEVQLAHGYEWLRDQETREGYLLCCLLLDTDGRVYDGQPLEPKTVAEYSRFTVFACNPLLPLLVAPKDPIARSTSEGDWNLLQLFHPRDALAGVTQVATDDSDMGRSQAQDGPGLCRYAAGSRPSWIPSLLPTTFKRLGDTPQSRGLGGHSNTMNRIFVQERRWRANHWVHNARPRGYPDPSFEDPRGFLSFVFLDPQNPIGSTPQRIQQFEWFGRPVRENPSST